MASSYLIHYASPYYDPQKAHEYYEEHKKLKGRTSTSGLNDTGKEAAKYVKSQIDAEKKSLIEKAKKVKESKTTTRKATHESDVKRSNEMKKSVLDDHKEQMNSKISSLRDRLKNMSKEDKAAHKDEINNQIAQLREQNKSERENITAAYKRSKEAINKAYSNDKKSYADEYSSKVKQYRENATNKYEAELNKMKEDSSMKATSKKTTKSVKL